MPSQSNIRKFVVGESFVKGNNLINLFNGSFPNLVVYTTDERYNSINNAKVKGSDIVSNGYTMNIILDGATAIGFEVELTNPIGTTQNPLNWAIGDTQGNLYLGVNQIDYDDTFNNVNKAVFNFVEEAY